MSEFRPVHLQVPDEVIHAFLEPYPRTDIPHQFVDEWWTVATFEEKVNSIDWDVLFAAVNKTASPGVPYHDLSATDGLLLESHRNYIIQLVIERLDRLLECGQRCLTMNAMQLVLHGLCDPIRVFIKNEPHLIKKIESGKLRIISSVSLVDQLVERLLFSRQNEAEIQNYDMIPSKPGFGMLEQQSVESIRAYVKYLNEMGPIAGTDMSSWDFTFQAWEWNTEFKMRALLCGAKAWDSWTIMAMARIRCVSLSVYALSDGSLYVQAAPGVMKSGCYLTSSTNSRMRAFCAFLRKSASMTMGDDCVENTHGDSFESMRAFYHKIGHNLKMITNFGENTIEFCSHQISETTVIPINWVKMLVNFLLRGEFDELSLTQLEMELKDLPRDRVHDVLRSFGVNV
jgi:hypothetical protein